MSKFLKGLSITVIVLFVLSIFGWMTVSVSKGKNEFGFLNKPIEFLYTFPDLFKKSVEEVKTLPRTFIKTDPDFKPINKLKDDLMAIITYSDTSDSRTIALINLKNDSVYKTWTYANPHNETTRIINPIYEPNGTLIYNWYYWDWPGIFRIDSIGNVVWKNDSLIVHHAINLNKDGDIWACTSKGGWKAAGFYTLGGKRVFYNDYSISKYDGETGKIIFHKSITEILKENGLANYILKGTNATEPIHLNDVQPALKTSSYFKEDDVFISLRNINTILHYRPSTNELLKVLEGPFVNQHDVDILNDSTLVLFNNNTYTEIPRKSNKEHNDSTRIRIAGDFYSNIVSYNLRTGEYGFIGDEVFRKNKIFTINEGLVEFIDDSTYFIEEQNSGLLWVIRNDEVIYKNVLKSQHEGYHHLPNWTRIVTNYE